MAIARRMTKFLNTSATHLPSQALVSHVRHGHTQNKNIKGLKFVKDPELFADDLPGLAAEELSKGGPKKLKKAKDRPVRSFKHRTEAYMLPFTLDVFISASYIHASIMHRMTNKVVAVASTNSKDLRSVLKSRCDINACRVVGQVLAERAKEADIFTALYYTRKNEKLEGKLLAVVDSVREHGINLLM